MPLSSVLARIVAYLRAGYPDGGPATDDIPLLALLHRRLSEDEVLAVATVLMSSGADTERVQRRLLAAGYPVTDSLGFLG